MKAIALPFPVAGDTCSGGASGGGTGGGGQCTEGAGSGLPAPIGLASMIWVSQCGCLAGDALIQLTDGTEKPASAIAEGDVLAGMNSEGAVAPQTVISTVTMTQPCLEITHEQGSFVCSKSHALIDQDKAEFTASGVCETEHCLLLADGTSTRVRAVRDVGAHQVYGWTCEPDHTFIASKVVHHNKVAQILQPIPVQVLVQ